MATSMETLGQLQSIGLIAEADGSYTVCWGRKRIKTARKLKWQVIEAKVYVSGLSVQHLLTLVENEQRRESLAVKIMAVEETRRKLPDDQICKLVGIRKSDLSKIVALIDGLIPELRQALLEGRMAQGTAMKATRLSVSQQADLAQLDKIRLADVKVLLQAKLPTFLAQLPDVLFEMPEHDHWQEQVQRKLAEIKPMIPLDRPDLQEAIARVQDCLERELLMR